MSHYILAIDQGTTSSRALLIDEALNVVGAHSISFTQHFPEPQWVEHDLDEIWNSVCQAVRGLLASTGIDVHAISAIGITNQRETTCVWRRDEVGSTFVPAIVWQDRRTAPFCEKLRKADLEKTIRRKTGLLLDPYFSGTKLHYLHTRNAEVQKLSKQGRLCVGTIDSFLLYRMTGEHRTDVSNASRTLLMNLHTCKWDDSLVKLFKLNASSLPEIFPSCVTYGKTRNFAGLPDGIPVTAMAGDQQSALFGQACFNPREMKCTYGTGAFILANLGTKPQLSKQRLLTSVAWKLGNKTVYCLEGSAFIAGAAVQWLRDGLGWVERSEQIEELAASVTDSDGVVFVPALSGMGAPHWLSNATGLFTGLTRRTTRGHMARAVLEGIAFQVGELVDAMAKDMGGRSRLLKVDGGASMNSLLMQFQTDLLSIPIVRAQTLETTALGVALQAGLGVGLWSDLESVRKIWKSSASFKPQIGRTERKKYMQRWNLAMKAVRAQV